MDTKEQKPEEEEKFITMTIKLSLKTGALSVTNDAPNAIMAKGMLACVGDLLAPQRAVEPKSTIQRVAGIPAGLVKPA